MQRTRGDTSIDTVTSNTIGQTTAITTGMETTIRAITITTALGFEYTDTRIIDPMATTTIRMSEYKWVVLDSVGKNNPTEQSDKLTAGLPLR